MVINFFYTLGLYIHNFVFWTTEMRMVVAYSFVCAQPYDMASCLAMFTNISATVIFIARVEMYFHSRYKAYSEAVIGGRLSVAPDGTGCCFSRNTGAPNRTPAQQ